MPLLYRLVMSTTLTLLMSLGSSCASPSAPLGASSLPEAVRQMVETAIATGDEKTIEAVFRVAREVSGSAGAEIDDLAACSRETAKPAVAELESAASAQT